MRQCGPLIQKNINPKEAPLPDGVFYFAIASTTSVKPMIATTPPSTKLMQKVANSSFSPSRESQFILSNPPKRATRTPASQCRTPACMSVSPVSCQSNPPHQPLPWHLAMQCQQPFLLHFLPDLRQNTVRRGDGALHQLRRLRCCDKLIFHEVHLQCSQPPGQ